MKLQSVGAYLRRLREQRGITREDLSATIRQLTEAGTNVAQIQRIEKGMLDTKASVLMAFVKAVDGSVDDIQSLLFDSISSEYIGESKADRLLQREKRRGELDDPRAVIDRYGKTRVLGRLFDDTERDLLKLDQIIPSQTGHHVYSATNHCC